MSVASSVTISTGGVASLAAAGDNVATARKPRAMKGKSVRPGRIKLGIAAAPFRSTFFVDLATLSEQDGNMTARQRREELIMKIAKRTQLTARAAA
jgi:hypothetical protein